MVCFIFIFFGVQAATDLTRASEHCVRCSDRVFCGGADFRGAGRI